MLHAVGEVGHLQVPQHHDGGKKYGSGVGDILSAQVHADVARSLLKECAACSERGAGRNARAAHKTGHSIAYERAVEIGCNHNVELLRLTRELHHTIINDNFLVLDVRPGLGDVCTRLEENAVGLLHDVRFMHCRDLSTVVHVRVLEGISSNATCRVTRHDFERLGYAWRNLVLHAGVFAFRILANYDDVDAGVP